MTELLTAAQMRAIEEAAIESGSVTGLELMERAGQGVVDAVMAEWPELVEGPRKAVVLCGPGNNGGDGFVVARLLKQAWWEVEVYLYGDAERLPPDARVNYERWCALGEVAQLLRDVWEARIYRGKFDLLVDALFGTGLTRAIDLPLVTLAPVRKFNQSYPIVSVDVPSGLCSDSGEELGGGTNQVFAKLTVSFHREKVGHRLALGPAACGKVVTKDIGLPSDDRPQAGVKRHPVRAFGRAPAEQLDEAVSLVGAPNGLEKIESHHKFAHGHALILSGGPGHTGAARLAARGALRIGAGLVTLGVPPAAQMEVASQVTAVMIKRIGDATVLKKVLEDERLNALCLGPALGLEDEKAELIEAALDKGAQDRAPYVVLDADALTLIAKHAGLFDKLHDRCVLTPHAGEFARLFPDIAETLNAPATKGPAYSKVDATRDAAKRAGCTVLFKGPDTVVASPDGRCSINASVYERAAPWLATAGSGDVLAGFITGLLARGFQPHDAAETAAWLHTECALSFGPGLIAEDLPEELPKVFRALGV